MKKIKNSTFRAVANSVSILLASLVLPLLNYRYDHAAWRNDPYLIPVFSIAAIAPFFIKNAAANIIYSIAVILLCYATSHNDISVYAPIFMHLFFWNLLIFANDNKGMK